MVRTEDSGGPAPSAPSGRAEETDGQTLEGGHVLLRSPPREIGFARGDLIAGRYQVEKVIGQGATGCVLQTYDRVVRAVVAVKILRPELADDQRWVERLGGELRYARKLQHPNVCRLHDLGESEGHHFLTMEFAEGGSLRQRLGGEPRPLEARIADARAVVAGLAAIHAAQFVHRDVKPENVLVMEDGRLVLTDFGLAVTPGQATFFGSQVAGTPTYMAPEVIFGEKATPAADVWALGVTLHEILFDRRPEWHTTKSGRTLKPPVGRGATRRERALAEVVAGCLVELPTRRLQDARAVERQLERALAGKRLSGYRRPLVAAVAVALALALGAGAWTRRRAQRADALGAPVVGHARSLATTPVFSTSKGIRCAQLLPDGKTLRMILDAPDHPAEVLDLSLPHGSTTPARVNERHYASGCPQLSPDGQSLVHTIFQVPRHRLMLSRPPDAEGQFLTEGSHPLWMPGGRQLLLRSGYTVALVALGGGSTSFPEAPPGTVFVDKAVDADGARVGLLFSQKDTGRGLLELYALPSRKLMRRIPLAVAASRLLFDPRSGRLRLLAPDPVWPALLELDEARGVVTRIASVADRALQDVMTGPAGLILVTGRATATVTVTDGSRRREIVRGNYLRGVDVTNDGSVLVEQTLADGRHVLGLARPGLPPQPFTEGPGDGQAMLSADARTVAFIASDRNAIVVCSLAGEQRPRCREVVREVERVGFLSLSPSGAQAAYVAVFRGGSRLRTRAVNVEGAGRELGLFESRCPPHWASESEIWLLDQDGQRWSAVDAVSGRSTGQMRAAGPGGCQNAPGQPPARVHTTISRLAEIRLAEPL